MRFNWERIRIKDVGIKLVPSIENKTSKVHKNRISNGLNRKLTCEYCKNRRVLQQYHINDTDIVLICKECIPKLEQELLDSKNQFRKDTPFQFRSFSAIPICEIPKDIGSAPYLA